MTNKENKVQKITDEVTDEDLRTGNFRTDYVVEFDNGEVKTYRISSFARVQTERWLMREFKSNEDREFAKSSDLFIYHLMYEQELVNNTKAGNVTLLVEDSFIAQIVKAQPKLVKVTDIKK